MITAKSTEGLNLNEAGMMILENIYSHKQIVATSRKKSLKKSF